MILDGKCKEDFDKWYFKNHCNSNMKYEELLPHHIYDVFGWLYEQSYTIQYAFIIEWFDSVGIYININNLDLQKWFFYEVNYIEKNEDGSILYRTRQQATEQAIIKAKEIYNAKTS